MKPQEQTETRILLQGLKRLRHATSAFSANRDGDIRTLINTIVRLLIVRRFLFGRYPEFELMYIYAKALNAHASLVSPLTYHSQT